MAKSGYLPDISGTFNYWRDKYNKGIESGNYDSASLALHNMNGSLDLDYRLPISSKEWGEKEDGYIVYECKECTETEMKTMNKGDEDEYEKEIEIPSRFKRTEIKIYTEECNEIVRLLIGSKTRKMWICPKCDNHSSVSSVEKTIVEYKSPNFRGCIYKEPDRPITGLQRRRGIYPNLMKQWCKNYSIELEHQLAVYRLEYIRQTGHDMEDSGYKDTGSDSV